MQNVLWLCSWYPNELLPFEGDFIQRHARAVSLFCKVHVIYAIRDAKGEITNDIRIKEVNNGNLSETIIYYYSKPFRTIFFDKYLSFLKFKRVFKQAIQKYLDENEKPDLIHVHTGMKAGLLSMWLGKKIEVPYVVTEHWTGFLKEAKENFKGLSRHLKHEWEKLLRNASDISAVSSYLGNAIKTLMNNQVSVTIIPNVVNASVFFPSRHLKKQPIGFIHVSGLDFQKNPEHILQAFAIVKKSGYLFSLDIFGPEKGKLEILVKDLDLADEVRFHREVPQPELSVFFQQADALILYSRYETFGCVIIEANACGVPVIVSDIPAMREIVEENKNGVFVKGEDPGALAEKVILFINRQIQFDAEAISSAAFDKYNYGEVGKQFYEWYKRLLENKKDKH